MMEEEISLEEIIFIIRQKLSSILLLGLIGLLLSGVYTFFIVTPQYESTSKLVVNQTQNTNQVITNNDIQTNLNLINTYQSIIQEPIILEEVLQSTESDLTLEELRDKISVQTQDQSLVFGVTAQDPSPYKAAEYANAIAQSFESKIGDIMEVQSVTILSQAVPNSNPVSPNVPMNLALGTLLGIIIGVGVSFLAEFMDKTVKDERFIESLGWTNLGAVMQMSEKEVEDTRFTRSHIETQNKFRRSAKRV